MGKIVRFRRRRKKRSAYIGNRAARQTRRLSTPPWLPVVALVAVAAVAYLSVEPRRTSVSGRGDFGLCSQPARQDCVIDGDTIRYRGAKIRLRDIDAPETFSPKCASEAALGARATRRLLELMNAGPFELVHGPGRDRDRYGRRLRLIERDGRSVGDTLIAEGLARPWDGARRSWCG